MTVQQTAQGEIGELRWVTFDTTSLQGRPGGASLTSLLFLAFSFLQHSLLQTIQRLALCFCVLPSCRRLHIWSFYRTFRQCLYFSSIGDQTPYIFTAFFRKRLEVDRRVAWKIMSSYGGTCCKIAQDCVVRRFLPNKMWWMAHCWWTSWRWGKDAEPVEGPDPL